MTLAEFKFWLDGYTEAGGTDIEVIKAKLAGVYDVPSFTPQLPSPWQTTPDYMPYRADQTGHPMDPWWMTVRCVNLPEMEPLGGEFARVWDDNTDRLYQE